MFCPSQNREKLELLVAYVDGRLQPGPAVEFESHLEVCLACREAVAAQSAVWNALDDWKAAEISSDFDQRLYGRIEAEQSRTWWRRVFQPVLPWSMRPAMPLAAAAMVLVAVGLLRSPEDSEWRLKATKLNEPMDIEQVESTLDDLEMLRQLGVASPADDGQSRTL
jgi:anti-sigma factor RsiW